MHLGSNVLNKLKQVHSFFLTKASKSFFNHLEELSSENHYRNLEVLQGISQQLYHIHNSGSFTSYFLEAQEDLKTTDILVCGRCHEVYHYTEEFQNHKSQVCTAKSTILPICEGESKPQVWGFTLWKTKQNRSLKQGEQVPTSWKTYQKWCKLAPIDKNAWISAGQTIQFCHKIASAKISEVKSKTPNSLEKDPLAIDGFGKHCLVFYLFLN